MKTYVIPFCLGFIFLFCPCCQAESSVIVFDRLTTVGKPVYLKVLTKGKFFPEGGKRVTFSINGTVTGKTMSGADGYAYFKYVPPEPGLQSIEAETDEGTGRGSLLVLDRRKQAIGIEIVGGLRNSILSPFPLPGSPSALGILHKDYAIVYLAKPLTTTYLKSWLEKENFPASVTLAWTGADTLSDLNNRGITFYAVIGSARLISEIADDIELRFTFERTDGPESVSDWNKVVDRLTGEK